MGNGVGRLDGTFRTSSRILGRPLRYLRRRLQRQARSPRRDARNARTAWGSISSRSTAAARRAPFAYESSITCDGEMSAPACSRRASKASRSSGGNATAARIAASIDDGWTPARCAHHCSVRRHARRLVRSRSSRTQSPTRQSERIASRDASSCSLRTAAATRTSRESPSAISARFFMMSSPIEHRRDRVRPSEERPAPTRFPGSRRQGGTVPFVADIPINSSRTESRNSPPPPARKRLGCGTVTSARLSKIAAPGCAVALTSCRVGIL